MREVARVPHPAIPESIAGPVLCALDTWHLCHCYCFWNVLCSCCKDLENALRFYTWGSNVKHFWRQVAGRCLPVFMSVMRVTPVAKGIRVLDGELLKLWHSPSFLEGPKPCHHCVTFSLLQNKECIKNIIAKTVVAT